MTAECTKGANLASVQAVLTNKADCYPDAKVDMFFFFYEEVIIVYLYIRAPAVLSLLSIFQLMK